MSLVLGIVLKKIDIGEDAAMFSLYTKEFGKLRAVAQGVKKEQAKLRGHLEPLNLISAQFVIGKNGARFTYAALEEYWDIMRGDWRAYSLARYIASLVEDICFENDRNEKLWSLLLENFAILNQKEFLDYRAQQVSFEIRFSESLGYTTKEDLHLHSSLTSFRV